MIRNLLLTAALAVTAVTGLTLTPATADAHPPIEQHRYHRVRFEVLVRHRNHWDQVATYRERDDARRAAWRLRQQGYVVKIEREGGW